MTDFSLARTRMIDSQIRTEDVSDAAVLAAMAAVPRERFVPASAADLAYIDRSVLLKEASASAPARYLLRPAAFAKLLQLAEISPADKVLDVGSGTGYPAAVLAKLARSVLALECDDGLAGTASERLNEIGAANARVVTGALEAGFPSESPYDLILLEGAVEFVPDALFDQLGEGGRLVAVTGAGGSAIAALYTKTAGDIGRRPAFNVTARPLPGFERPKSFVF